MKLLLSLLCFSSHVWLCRAHIYICVCVCVCVCTTTNGPLQQGPIQPPVQGGVVSSISGGGTDGSGFGKQAPPTPSPAELDALEMLDLRYCNYNALSSHFYSSLECSLKACQ